MRFVLQPGERVLYDRWTKRRSMRITTAFGRLKVTDQRVAFLPFFFGLPIRSVEIPMDQIDDVQAVWGPGIPPPPNARIANDHLRLRTKSGDDFRFWVYSYDLDRVVKWIDAERQRYETITEA